MIIVGADDFSADARGGAALGMFVTLTGMPPSFSGILSVQPMLKIGWARVQVDVGFFGQKV